MKTLIIFITFSIAMLAARETRTPTEIAHELLSAGKPLAALPYLEKIVGDAVLPEEQKAAALFQQAEIYFQQAQFANLQATCARYRTQFADAKITGKNAEKNRAQILLWAAQRHSVARKFSEAAADYREFLRQFPTHIFAPNARRELATALLHLNRENEAAAELLTLENAGETLPPTQTLWLARTLFRQKQFAAAATYYRRALENLPPTQLPDKNLFNEIHLRLAMTALELGDPNAAENYLTPLITTLDDDATLLYTYTRGRLAAAKNDYPTAMALLFRVGLFAADRELAGTALWRAAQLSRQQQDLPRARLCYEELAGRTGYGARYPAYRELAAAELEKIQESPNAQK